jgi:hypothetical protein
MQAVRGLAMEKGLCWGSLGVAALMLLFFILDITPLGIPFGGMSTVVDIFGILASAILLYMSFDALRDLP